jgi:hypothetical protein
MCFCEDVHASGSILGLSKRFETMFADQSPITTATKTGKRDRLATAVPDQVYSAFPVATSQLVNPKIRLRN